MLFRKCGCLVEPENRIFQKLISVDQKKKALTTEIILHFHFHFKVFSEKEREREREREREKRAQIGEREEEEPRSRRRSRSTDRTVDRAIDHDRRKWCFARSRSTLREIVPSIAIS